MPPRATRRFLAQLAAAALCLLTAGGCARDSGAGAADFSELPPQGGARARPADDVAPPGERGLFDTLENLIASNPELGADRELREQVAEAGDVYSRAKEDSRRALRVINRQLRAGRAPPSVVLIIAPALGYHDLGCYGQRNLRTPFLDGLALQGVRFTNYYAGSSLPGPSRWSLLTGREPRGRGGTAPLNPSNQNTLPHVLWQANFDTGIVGDCSLGGDPRSLGFEEWFGFRDADQAADPFATQIYDNGGRIRLVGNAEGARRVPVRDLLIQEALGFLDRHRGRPQFLYLALPAADVEVEGGGEFDAASSRFGSAAEARQAAAVARLDRDLGQILEQLRQLKLERTTVVAVTALAGPPADAQLAAADVALRGGQGTLYEAGLRVPLIIHGARGVAVGGVCDQLCAAHDLLPTLAALVQASRQPRGTDGRSLVAALRGQANVGHRTLRWSLPDGAQAIRRGHWKALRSASDLHWQLYSLAEDPREENDLAEEQPEVLAELLEFLPPGEA